MAALRIASSFLLPLLIAAAAAPAALAQGQSSGETPFYPRLPPSSIHINGTVPCSVGPMTPATPAFANASVLLQCDEQVISNTTSDVNGRFGLVVDTGDTWVMAMLLLLEQGCKLLVRTPLSDCNASLPTTSILQSPLKPLLGGINGGPLNFVPEGFNLLGL